MKTNVRRQWLKKFAVTGMLGSAGLSGLISEVLANGAKPLMPGIQKISGSVSVNGNPASVLVPVLNQTQQYFRVRRP